VNTVSDHLNDLDPRWKELVARIATLTPSQMQACAWRLREQADMVDDPDLRDLCLEAAVYLDRRFCERENRS
jgi:hypothetical protein